MSKIEMLFYPEGQTQPCFHCFRGRRDSFGFAAKPGVDVSAPFLEVFGEMLTGPSNTLGMKTLYFALVVPGIEVRRLGPEMKAGAAGAWRDMFETLRPLVEADVGFARVINFVDVQGPLHGLYNANEDNYVFPTMCLDYRPKNRLDTTPTAMERAVAFLESQKNK